MTEQPRETAGTTMRLIIDYVRTHGGESAVAALLDEAGETRPLSVLEDENVWSSYDAKIRLLEAAAVVTGQPNAARRIGESALVSNVGGSVKLLIGLVGSPAQVLRGISRANSKLSTAAEMTPLSVERTSALVRNRVLDGYVPSAHGCDYTAGLLSQVPVLFGLPGATVRHDVCQVRGAEACLYALRWHARRRFRRRRGIGPRAHSGMSAATVLQRLEDLQETVAELVADRSVEEVLTVVAERARSTVGAQRFLLAARLSDAELPRIHSDGFAAAEAEGVATRLLADLPPDTGEHVIVAPLRSSGRDYGRIAAFGRSSFYDHEQDLLRSYASLAATGLDAVTALDDARDRHHVAEVLLGFARALLETRDRAQVAQATAEAALSVAFADAASVMLVDRTDRTLRMAARAGWPDDLVPLVDQMAIRPGDTTEMSELWEHPEAPRMYDATSTDPFILRVLETFRCSHLVVIPLWSGSRLWGIVVTAWGADAVPPTTERLIPRLSGLADQAVTAFDRAELAEQVHRQATVDPLTGLSNRQEFTDRLELALSRQSGHRRAGDDVERCAVVFLDLDRFKSVNDTLGHAAGDELLCTVGRRLREMTRAEDLVARIGGDEFTLLLPAVRGRSDLEDFADRIRAALAEPVTIEGQQVETPPSVGALLLSPAYTSVRDVLRAADAAMYAAKKGGGNSYVLADGPDDRLAVAEA